jgi:6-phosphogluconolactonase
MGSSVTAFAYKSGNGSLVPLETVSTLSTLRKDYAGPKEAAEIAVHPNGKFLYASNRAGIDTISAFSTDPVQGAIKLRNEYPTMGKTPRNFAIDPTGKFLVAANQESGNIVIFRIDPITGTLSPTGEVTEVPAPVCLTFLQTH